MLNGFGSPTTANPKSDLLFESNSSATEAITTLLQQIRATYIMPSCAERCVLLLKHFLNLAELNPLLILLPLNENSSVKETCEAQEIKQSLDSVSYTHL